MGVKATVSQGRQTQGISRWGNAKYLEPGAKKKILKKRVQGQGCRGLKTSRKKGEIKKRNKTAGKKEITTAHLVRCRKTRGPEGGAGGKEPCKAPGRREKKSEIQKVKRNLNSQSISFGEGRGLKKERGGVSWAPGKGNGDKRKECTPVVHRCRSTT